MEHIGKVIEGYLDARKKELFATRQARSVDLLHLRDRIASYSEQVISIEAEINRIDGALSSMESLKAGLTKTVETAQKEEEE